MKITQINRIPRNQEEVFNLEVKDNNNYFANSLLVSNCHVLNRSNEINKVFRMMNTEFRFGFTGTLPADIINQWNVIGKLGPVVYEEKTNDLKDQKFVSNFKIMVLKIKHDNVPKIKIDKLKPTKAYEEELEFLMHSERRNGLISKLSSRLDNNTIIMVDRIDHGINIERTLREQWGSSRPIYFIRGSTEMEEREKIRDLMATKSNVIVVAISKIFSTGINIPNLHYIIFASAGKAKIKIMQSIGRALRLHPTKVLAVIFDISDNTRYGKRHLEERLALYRAEKYTYEEKDI